MAASEFDRALKAVLVHEGGNVDHPKDPGGRTSHGVIQRVYDGWRRTKGLPVQDVWKSTATERAAIYRAQYWNKIRGDDLPAGVGYVVFDGAVNSGPVQSVKWLQRALGVTVDGTLGEATLSAARGHENPEALIDAICDKRMAFLRALKTWPTFGKGWSRRVAEVRKVGKALASGVGSPAMTPEIGKQRAPITDAKKPKPLGPADAAAGVGVGTAGAAPVIKEATDALQPLAGTSEAIASIVAVLVVAGAVMTLGGLAYRWWANQKNAELTEALA